MHSTRTNRSTPTHIHPYINPHIYTHKHTHTNSLQFTHSIYASYSGQLPKTHSTNFFIAIRTTHYIPTHVTLLNTRTPIHPLSTHTQTHPGTQQHLYLIHVCSILPLHLLGYTSTATIPTLHSMQRKDLKFSTGIAPAPPTTQTLTILNPTPTLPYHPTPTAPSTPTPTIRPHPLHHHTHSTATV